MLDDMVHKEARFTVDNLTNTFAVTDRVGMMKVITGLLDWVQTVNVQTDQNQYQYAWADLSLGRG